MSSHDQLYIYCVSANERIADTRTADENSGPAGSHLHDHVHCFQLSPEHSLKNLRRIRLRQSWRNFSPCSVLCFWNVHLHHAFLHSQVWIQKSYVLQFSRVRSIWRSRSYHLVGLRFAKESWMDIGHPWSHALRCICLDDMGGTGVLCEPGGRLGQKDRTIRVILESDDVISNRWKPHNHFRVGAGQQCHILLGFDHFGM